MLKIILLNIGMVLGSMIVGPFFFVYLLATINRDTKAMIASRFGTGGQLIFGFLGIILHEASHLLVAIIFGHHILSVRLIRRPTIDNPSLGYVNHTWRADSLYQKIGNLFIGIAPIFGCCTIILLLAKWLLPDIYSQLIVLTQRPLSQLYLTWPTFEWGNLLIFGLLTINICIGGFDLSTADYQNATQGLVATILLLIVLTILISGLPFGDTILRAGMHFTKILIVISSFNLMISIILNLSFRLL